MIKVRGLSKSYDGNLVFKNVNLDIKKGSTTVIIGGSGCGKSTLLRCLAGLEAVQAGKIYLDGTDITNLDARKLYHGAEAPSHR